MRESATGKIAWLAIESHKDVTRATVLVTAIALAGSWLITALIILLTGATSPSGIITAVLASTLAPLVLAPLLSRRNFRLMLRLNQACTEVERLSRTDDLTQIYNRRYFMEMTLRELALGTRHGYPVALLLLDLDSFKEINDELGHLAGDRALASCAATIQRTIRQGDVLGRFGGDEFLVLAPHTGLDSAARLAERIRETMAGQGVMAGGRKLTVRLSVGVVTTEQGTTSADDLLRLADRALYRAKEMGGDRIELAA
ncbi:MAG: GGDEF domain-containing protein [Desulfarculaceae bacterium]|nr:GGDEF domain-containing protein [Desulfarculaceae bacterium]MCF8070823.1 GGDEF domain-containing protein [Desulfarculaceae bacterium]MCF8102260.1 GGDEF domain-containing protein [Desulfarculaceae bacterium]MCF8117678.1 GGDEF domain-containing protein [Desulfarculaceae bacterium]